MSADADRSLPVPGTPPDPAELDPAFKRLVDIVATLRGPDGCPWDRQQTLASIKPYTLEETYELLEAIDGDNDEEIVEELGDVLLQVLLDSQIAADEGRFDLTSVVATISRKLVDRHPHVFGDVDAKTSGDVIRNWDRIKQEEKQERESIMDGVPKALPALARAARVADKAARVGYDFPHRDMLFAKLREELDELSTEMFDDGQFPTVPATVDVAPVADVEIDDPAQHERVEAELGDVLFVLANVARRWKINPEEALRKSSRKFETRFRAIERTLKERGSDVATATLQEMEAAYQAAKRNEDNAPC